MLKFLYGKLRTKEGEVGFRVEDHGVGLRERLLDDTVGLETRLRSQYRGSGVHTLRTGEGERTKGRRESPEVSSSTGVMDRGSGSGWFRCFRNTDSSVCDEGPRGDFP